MQADIQLRVRGGNPQRPTLWKNTRSKDLLQCSWNKVTAMFVNLSREYLYRDFECIFIRSA